MCAKRPRKPKVKLSITQVQNNLCTFHESSDKAKDYSRLCTFQLTSLESRRSQLISRSLHASPSHEIHALRSLESSQSHLITAEPCVLQLTSIESSTCQLFDAIAGTLQLVDAKASGFQLTSSEACTSQLTDMESS